jgi:hypothetical protein
MATPEIPTSRAPEMSEQGSLFRDSLNSYETVLGPKSPELPREMTIQWIERQLTDMVKDHRVETFNEQARYNELLYRRAAIQRLKDVQEAKTEERPVDRVKLQELIVAEQAVTYHEYFREAQNQVLSVLRRYESMRRGVQVSQDILRMEGDTQRYVAALQEASRERVAFSNVVLIDRHIAEKFGDVAHLNHLRQEFLSQLSPASLASLEGGNEQRLIRANQLNQRIIDILGGEHGLQGVERGYVPKQMMVAFLKYRYQQLLDQQIQIGRDPSLQKTRAELDRLNLKFKMAEEGKGEFTAEDKARHDELQARLNNVNVQFEQLGRKRRETTQELITLTQDLGEYNLHQTELSAIQEQFGRKYSFEGVSGLSPLSTPPEIREAIAQNMEMRKAHHLGQMSNFLERVQKDVLKKGFKEEMENLWNKNGREAVRRVTHSMASFFTFAVPEKFGMHDAAQDALTQPLDEAMGWPAGKEKWEELTPQEQQKVKEKATSILNLIEKFDKTKIQNFQESIQLVQSMKPASAYTLDQVKFDESGQAILPEGRVTAQNINLLTAEHGGAVVYLMLIRQLQGDFGSYQPPQAFMGEYASFLEGVNKNIDVHVDVGRACYILGKRFEDLMKWLLLAAGLGLVIGVIGTLVVLKLGGKAARAAGNGLLRGGRGLVRLTTRLVRPSAASAGGAVVSEAPAAAAESTATQGASTAEKAVEGTSRASRVGKVLGPLGIVLVAADLRRVMMRDARLQPLQELDGIQAAIELWENDKIVDTRAPRHNRELAYLKRRLQCFVMEDGSAKLAQEIQKRKAQGGLSEVQQAKAEQLQERCEKVRMFARQAKMEYERLMPVTDYLVTDPKKEEGNVGIDIQRIDQARARGVEHEEEQRRTEMLQQSDPKWRKQQLAKLQRGLILPPITGQKREEKDEESQPANVAEKWNKFAEAVRNRERDLTRQQDLEEEYQYLLEDGAEFLEQVGRAKVSADEAEKQAELAASILCERTGKALMNRIGANVNEGYYTKQFGWVANKFLYMKFDQSQGKWLVSLGNLENPQDPATYSVGMWGGTDKYTKLIADLAAINAGNKPSQ